MADQKDNTVEQEKDLHHEETLDSQTQQTNHENHKHHRHCHHEHCHHDHDDHKDHEHCDCHDDHCQDDCHCKEDCDCHEECHCHEQPKIKEINLDYLDLAQRLKAEFDNYKRRNADVKKEAYDDGVADVVKKLLPVLDGFCQAKKNIADKTILEGVELLHKQLLDVLTSLGVEKIECVGKSFDPHLHNAVVAVEVEGVEPNMVVEEYQEGFRLKDKIIRHSVVRISK